jgi:hypothetical protein
MASSVLGDSRILMSTATVVAVPGSMDATWETVVHPSAPKLVGLGRGCVDVGDVFFTFTSERNLGWRKMGEWNGSTSE